MTTKKVLPTSHDQPLARQPRQPTKPSPNVSVARLADLAAHWTGATTKEESMAIWHTTLDAISSWSSRGVISYDKLRIVFNFAIARVWPDQEYTLRGFLSAIKAKLL